jgi:guanine deaminase
MTTSRYAVEPVTAIRGAVLSYTGDPFLEDPAVCTHYESDAIVAMAGGHIVDLGTARGVAERLPPGTPVARYSDSLIIAGFVDGHAHYPQTQVIAAYGRQLLDWLNECTYPAEQRFGDRSHARDVARVFLQECLRSGTTTAAVFCTVHPESVDAFFDEAGARGMRMLAGKVLMDRNAPDRLLDTAQRGYDESKALLLRWHGRGRLLYCVTPRFAATSSPAQLEAASALWREHPGTYLQSHIAESADEVAWVSRLYPERSGYLDVYDHHGALGPRAIYGHGIWLTDADLSRCHETGTALAHCPTSNTFLGSGLFKLRHARNPGRSVRVALATDVGAGTSFSMLATMHEAYKVAQLTGHALTARQAFYLATRGGAHALYLDDRIGSIAVGMEADVVVLDLKSTPLIAHRMQHCGDLDEALFIQMMLGDDRAVRATYVAGTLAYERPG